MRRRAVNAVQASSNLVDHPLAISADAWQASTVEIEPYSQVMARKHMYSMDFLRRWPQMEADIRRVKDQVEAGVKFKDAMPWLEEEMFKLQVKMLEEGKPLDRPPFGIISHTRYPGFIETLPFKEINPWQGKRY